MNSLTGAGLSHHTTHYTHNHHNHPPTAANSSQMSVVSSLPRLDSYGGAALPFLERLDSFGAAADVKMDDVSIDKLLEGYNDLQEDWDSGTMTYGAPAKAEPVMSRAPLASTAWQPTEQCCSVEEPAAKKRKKCATELEQQQQQVMQMPGTWFDMPEFAPATGGSAMQNAMSDTMMFDAINEAVINENQAAETRQRQLMATEDNSWLSTFHNEDGGKPEDGIETPQNDDPPPPYTETADGEATTSLDDNILSFFRTGEFRDVVVNAHREGAPKVATNAKRTTSQPVAHRPSPTATATATSTGTQKIVTRGRYQFSFGPEPDSAVAAKKRAIRLAALARYRQKKIDRINNPVIRYKSRKKIADNRPRVKGRFIKTGNTVRAEPNAQKA